MLSRILRGAVLATFAVGATVAQADVFTGASDTQDLYWVGFDTGSVGVSVTGYNGSGGQFNGYFGTNGLADDFFRFFCIELGQYATGGPILYTRAVLNPASAEAKQLSWLFTTVPYPKTGGFTTGPASIYGKLPDATTSGAMQLAVWEIMIETNEVALGLDLTDGTFVGSGSDASAVTMAQGWLATVQANVGNGNNNWEFYTYTSASNQNYLAARYGSYDRSVPLPGTLALFGIGLAGLGLARRKA